MAPDTFFEKIANPYVTVLALLVFAGSVYAMLRLNPGKEIEKRLSVPYVPVGQTFGYPSGDLRRMLDAFGTQKDGKELKEKYQRFFYYDLIYPWVYALSLALVLAYLQRRLNLPDPVTGKEPIKTHYLWAIPIAAGVFDYAENLSMLLILRSYDGSRMPLLFGFSRLMTMLKLVFLYASFFLVLYLIIILPLTNLIKSLFKGAEARQALE